MKRLIISMLFLLGATLIFSQAENTNDSEKELVKKEIPSAEIAQAIK